MRFAERDGLDHSWEIKQSVFASISCNSQGQVVLLARREVECVSDVRITTAGYLERKLLSNFM